MWRVIACAVLMVCAGPSMCAAELPPFSWSTVPLFAHCGNSSGEIDIEVAKFFSTLSFVTIEKWHALESNPEYHGAESKIADAARLIKSYSTPVQVLYQGYLRSSISSLILLRC